MLPCDVLCGEIRRESAEITCTRERKQRNEFHGGKWFMTLLDVVFKYGATPGERTMWALNNAWEVYGVRKIKLDEKEHTIRVEYDATRLNDSEIAAILRRAGIDLREKVQLV
jgi:hypothetical protein